MRTLHTSSFTECCVVGLVVCMLWALHVCKHRVCVFTCFVMIVRVSTDVFITFTNRPMEQRIARVRLSAFLVLG